MLRVALALSAFTGKPFAIHNIRSERADPGLKAQHVFCVKGLKQLCNAIVTGAELGSTSLTFVPGTIEAKTISLDVGTAGSLTLLLQSLLLPCMVAKKRIRLKLQGGTDTKWAMPVDYFRDVFLPHMRKYADITCTVTQRGYYPAGNGIMDVIIKPKHDQSTIVQAPPINLTEQGTLAHIKGICHAAAALEQQQVAERIAAAARLVLAVKYPSLPIRIQTQYCKTVSVGAGITLIALFQNKYGEINDFNPVILGADAQGEKGKPAEAVGKEAAQKLLFELATDACTDQHLADNLIPFMALHPPSQISTSVITNHTRTNIHVVEQFLPVTFAIEGNRISCLAK